MTTEERESLIEFPCDFPIKAMGESGNDFDALVVAIIREHVSDLNEGAVNSKQSSGGKYTSVTVTIQAISQLQIDTIYRSLTAHERIKYVL